MARFFDKLKASLSLRSIPPLDPSSPDSKSPSPVSESVQYDPPKPDAQSESSPPESVDQEFIAPEPSRAESIDQESPSSETSDETLQAQEDLVDESVVPEPHDQEVHEQPEPTPVPPPSPIIAARKTTVKIRRVKRGMKYSRPTPTPVVSEDQAADPSPAEPIEKSEPEPSNSIHVISRKPMAVMQKRKVRVVKPKYRVAG